MKHFRIGLAALSILWMTGRDPVAQTTTGTVAPAWWAEGNQRNAAFGFSVSGAGDVNGDGYGDVIVGAYSLGRAYVFHGSKIGLSKVPAWTAEVDQVDVFIEQAAAAGDVNGDGYGDVIVGFPGYSNGEFAEGIARVYHGSAAGLGTSPAWAVEGNQQGALFGRSVAAVGDVNGDGYGDVIVGAVFNDISTPQQSEGAAYVYLGSASGLSTSPVWTAEGNQPFAEFGNGRSAGDVNGDGYGDVVVGAWMFDHGELDEGRAFVYLGSASGPSASPDWKAEGDQTRAYFGSTVGSAGDVNGDGYDDMIVGSYGYKRMPRGPEVGRVFVYLGSAAGLSTSPAWTVVGDVLPPRFFGTGFGLMVSGAGDLDGDGYDDVIIGAPFYTHFQRNEGRVFAFFGSPLGLATRTSWIAESDQRDADFARTLATAGDVNGDGFSDVIVGAYSFDHGQLNEGVAFVYLGSSRRRLP